MRADICDPNNKEGVQRFKAVLDKMGAKKSDHSWAPDVDVYSFQINGETLIIFSDSLSIDIEGPEHLVRMVVDAFLSERS